MEYLKTHKENELLLWGIDPGRLPVAEECVASIDRTVTSDIGVGPDDEWSIRAKKEDWRL